LEWADGKGRYEVELFGEDVVMRRAAELDEAWRVTHAAFANSKPIRGEDAFFGELIRRVLDHSEAESHNVIRAIIVGELYEGLGKIRNSMLSGTHESLPRVTMRIELMAELMVGLAHRHIYTSAGRATAQSMGLAPRPPGHDELCDMVRRGELNDPEQTSEVVERYWKGVIEWAVAEDMDLALACKWPI
jgi:kanamycin nucleotidyltransferase